MSGCAELFSMGLEYIFVGQTGLSEVSNTLMEFMKEDPPPLDETSDHTLSKEAGNTDLEEEEDGSDEDDDEEVDIGEEYEDSSEEEEVQVARENVDM